MPHFTEQALKKLGQQPLEFYDKLQHFVSLEEANPTLGMDQIKLMGENREIFGIYSSRYLSPYGTKLAKVDFMWKCRFGTDGVMGHRFSGHISLEEIIAEAMEVQINPNNPFSLRESSQEEIAFLLDLRDNTDVAFVFISNMLVLYKKMMLGNDFIYASQSYSFKTKSNFSLQELKNEILFKTKILFELTVSEVGNSTDDLCVVHGIIYSICNNFEEISSDEFLSIFPPVLMEKLLDMVTNESVHDLPKTSFLSYLKGVVEKAPHKFHSMYFDTFFKKKKVFLIAPKFTSYWTHYLFVLSSFDPGTSFEYLVSQIVAIQSFENNEVKENSSLLIFESISNIINRQGKEFLILHDSATEKVKTLQFSSIGLQKQYFKILNEVEMILTGKRSSPISAYMKTLEKTSNNNIVFIAEFNGTKKKMSMLDTCGYTDFLLLMEERFSIDRNNVIINVFDTDCRDYVELDPSEHDFNKLSNPIKIKLVERVEKQEINESSLISSIDHYKILRQLKSDREQSPELISMTFIAEEKQLNTETKKISIKYLNFKGNRAEGNLSENILMLKKVKEFEKSNLVPIYEILKPEAINKQKVKKVHHLAFTMPYYTHGSVATIMKEKISLSTRMILSLLKYSLEGFNSLEEARFEYGNIKEENILIETLDLASGIIRIRVSDWWIVSKSKIPAISFLGAAIYRMLTFDKLDVSTLMSNDFTQDKITQQIQQKQNKSSSSTLSIAIEVISFLLGKSGTSIPITARNALKILYKRVKEAKEKQ